MVIYLTQTCCSRGLFVLYPFPLPILRATTRAAVSGHAKYLPRVFWVSQTSLSPMALASSYSGNALGVTDPWG